MGIAQTSMQMSAARLQNEMGIAVMKLSMDTQSDLAELVVNELLSEIESLPVGASTARIDVSV